jgi:hypothetical protein
MVIAVSGINPLTGGYASIIGIAVWSGWGCGRCTNSDAIPSKFWQQRMACMIWTSGDLSQTDRGLTSRAFSV